tara:strand:+ start:114 stop:611 length:498 start_codon:yes stop_codon:yes gene_type:complete
VSKVFVQENFFNKDTYQKIVNEMISVEYDAPDSKKRKIHDGSYWHTHNLPDGCEVQKEIQRLIQKHFNFKISSFVCPSSYTMVGATDKPRPHTDEDVGSKFQCLIYMYGPESVNNGTGFYKDNELNIHVGFKNNRAIFFSSDVVHTPLQWNGNGSFRYSICNFFT